MNSNHLLRNFQAGITLQSFLVAAVSSVIMIRLYLSVTGYPQLGGAGLHIAHMLWGGLLMLASIIILLSFLSRASQQFAAIVGGIGFGTFIDEVGKFVTSDNDYFFQPAVALIYVIFILLFLAIRAIHTEREYTRQEYLVNALQEMEEVARHDLDPEEKRRALHYLEQSDQSSPLVAALKTSLSGVDLIERPKASLVARVKNSIRSWYYSLANYTGFTSTVVGFFIVQQVLKLTYVGYLVLFDRVPLTELVLGNILRHLTGELADLSFVDYAEIGSTLISTTFVVWGVMLIKRSRLAAFRMFERSVLITIFLTQVFIFYKEQFHALAGLAFNILVLVTVRFMINREKIVQTHVTTATQITNSSH